MASRCLTGKPREDIMHYQTIHAGRVVDKPHWSRRLKHLPTVVVALLVAYGVASHHVLAVALVLLAGVTFGYRLQQTAGRARRGAAPGAQHIDGGSFSGNPDAGSAAHNGRPTVLDGGTERSSRSRSVQTGHAEVG